MSVVQSTYPNVHSALALGQIADTATCDVDSFSADEAIPFGFGVGRTATGVELGAARELVGTIDAALTAAATEVDVTIPSNDGRFGEVLAGEYYLIEDEIVYVRTADSDGITVMVRGALGTTAAAHVTDTEVYRLQGGSTFVGVAVMDERTRASNTAGQYAAGEIVSVLYRGDVAVRVAHAVSVGDAAGLRVASGDDFGKFTNRPSSHNHVQIAGAEFLTAAAADGIAVLRLAGPSGNVMAQTR